MRATEAQLCWFLAESVEISTSTTQPKPDADAKTGSTAKSAGRRSSRGGFTSSSNLKIKDATRRKDAGWLHRKLAFSSTKTQ